MTKRYLIALLLLIILTTITSHEKISFSKFNLKEINIENTSLIKEDDLKNLLSAFYNKNLIFLKNSEIKKALKQNSLVESFNVKKKYPDTLKIKIVEKKPIAVLFIKKKKYYLSEKIELIEFKDINNFKELPYVFGNKDEFKLFYENLKKNKFPIEIIKKYILYESNRWDLETKNNVIIKLPPEKYLKSLENYLSLIHSNDFKNYTIFDYRIESQLILK
tara:strand:- start:1054 stop:1710 length:657 start_codon:yes stop_codon:yes gene_type:complete